ncbi:amino acid transporter [Dichomitus squalens]|nr:amino acid transporter [Dichomitus squalens]
MDTSSLRERPKAKRVEHVVRIGVPVTTRHKLQQQRARILKFQRRWQRIKDDLPPQLSRSQIGMISIGGVIGTGLFLGCSEALRSGGPIGSFLGYSLVGSVVYCLCVSIGEMIAFLPNVGGVVGLADLYVDPALGFSLGWASWYNWAIALPTEIVAAAVIIGFWDADSQAHVAIFSAIFLAWATVINCFPTRVYGQMEYYLSFLKFITIILIVVLGLAIDLGASPQGRLGFRYWKERPFPDNYLGTTGTSGHFLGFWAVIMQASFSFSGSEVPGIAAGEVIDATRNVPRALRKVWIRITLFYLGGVLVSGLLVPYDDPFLALGESPGHQNGHASPFVIAFTRAGWKLMPNVVNAAILLSALSAASSDIYISSRFLFFLARRKHAPSFLDHLVRYPRARVPRTQPKHGELSTESDSDSNEATDGDIGDQNLGLEEPALVPDQIAGEQVLPSAQAKWVMPLPCVLVCSLVGLLTFLGYGTGSANKVFVWLVNAAAVASIQSWAGMLYTYIRWHKGTVHYEIQYKGRDTHEAQEALAQIERIKKNRSPFQPHLAWYALILCVFVILTNGMTVFIHHEWKIAVASDQNKKVSGPDEGFGDAVSQFLAAYVPLPFFLVMTFGYKLVWQTEMIPYDKMTFDGGHIPPRTRKKNRQKGG